MSNSRYTEAQMIAALKELGEGQWDGGERGDSVLDTSVATS